MRKTTPEIKKSEQKSNRTYGIIGLVVLFFIGGIFGYIMNGSDHVNRSHMTQQECQRIANQIINASGDFKGNGAKPELIAQLNKVYSENCLNREFEQPQPKPEQKIQDKKLPEETCAAIEELLKHDLNDENSMDPWDHKHNFEIYTRLADKGCEKNKEKYLNLAQRENEIAKALGSNNEVYEPDDVTDDTTCEQIERVLLPRLECVYGREICGNPDTHVNNAKIYANLSERGCAENSQKYKELAKQELEIARALTDDDIANSERQSVEIVETYKRLQMQAEAARMIEKAKKIANPAIDFIIQLEKIIEE